MPESSLPIEQILTILAATMPHLASLTANLSSRQLHAAPSPGEWSVHEVLAHLRACNEVWGSNILRIITEDKPEWRGINPRAWIKKTDILEQDFHSSFKALAQKRSALLANLESLPTEGWFRTATVIDMVGKRIERTALSYAAAMARHERTHVRQIERIVKSLTK